MIAPEPVFEPRGTPISIYSRLRMLSHIGYEVDLITYPIGSDIDIPGVTVYRTAKLPFIKRVKVGPSWPKLFLDMLLFFKSFQMLLTRRYDVIHSHEEAAFFCVLLAPIFRVRHIYDMHSSLPRQLANFNFGNLWPVVKVFELLENLVLHTSDAVITVGTDLEAYIRHVNPQAHCTNIENLPVHEVVNANLSPSESHTYQVPPGKLSIVYTGTLERYQGLSLIFDSAAAVLKACPDVVFVIVGGSPEQVQKWCDYVHALELDEWVLFVGRVSLEESVAYLELAQILVSPRIEGTSVPLKIYSYLHSGKAIIATRIEAHTQVLDDEIALLVEPDALAFAEGLIRLIQSADLRQQLGAAASRRAAERYNLNQQAKKLEVVYQSLQASR